MRAWKVSSILHLYRSVYLGVSGVCLSVSQLSHSHRSASQITIKSNCLRCNFMFIFSLIFIINKLGIIQMTIFPAAPRIQLPTAQMKRSIIIAHVSHKQLVWAVASWSNQRACSKMKRQKQKRRRKKNIKQNNKTTVYELSLCEHMLSWCIA